MRREERLAYDESSEKGRFREQHRSVFAGVIIATVFVVPDDNVVLGYLRSVLVVASVFAAFYLISTAAQMKYSDPGRIFDTFYVSERTRNFAFDWSVNIFGLSFLLFLGISLTGLTQSHFEVNLTGWAMYSVIVLYSFAVGTLALIFSGSAHGTEVDSKSSEN